MNWVSQVSEKPFLDVRTYNFRPQTGTGSLTAATPATRTIAPCPLGVSASSAGTGWYISGGIGTAETVVLTSVTPSGGNCAVGFTPANSHSGAWTLQSATLGWNEAVNAAASACGQVWGAAGTYILRAAIQVPGCVSLVGAGENATILQYANASIAAVPAWQVAGHSGQYCGICLNDGSFHRIRDLTIDANGVNQTWLYYGDINGVAVNHVLVERVTIKNHVNIGGTGVTVILSGTDNVIQNSSSIGIATGCTVPNGGGAFYIAGSASRILSSYATNNCDSPFVMANCDHCLVGDSVSDVGAGQMATGTFELEGCVDCTVRNATCVATGTNPSRYCVRLTNALSGPSAQSSGVQIQGVVSTHSSQVIFVAGSILTATTNVIDTQISGVHADNTGLSCVQIGPYVQKLNLANSDLEACGALGADGLDIVSTGSLAVGAVAQQITINNVKIDHANGIGIRISQTSTGPVVSGLKITNSYIGDSYASPIQTVGISMLNGGTAVNDIYIAGNTLLGNTSSATSLATGFGSNTVLGPNFTSTGATDFIVNQVLGASVASATTINATGPLFHITGTTAIQTINAAAYGLNNTVCGIPDGLWSTNTSGNIALGSTAVVGKMLCWGYDPVLGKWFPSY